MRARQIGKKNRSLTYWCTEKYAWKRSSRRAPLGAVTRWKDARHTKIQLVLHQVGRRTTPERRIVGASTVKNVAVWWAGKALKIQIKWELLIHNKNKEAIGVNGSTAATRWYRFLSPWDGGSSPLSPPNNYSDWFSEIRTSLNSGPWGSSDLVHIIYIQILQKSIQAACSGE